jgi:dienelactone hydrolase
MPGDPTLQNLDRRLREALGALVHPGSAAEADAARKVLRKKLEYSLGFRRFAGPPKLDGRITGTVRRDGYRIEKIVYQSLPGSLVAAHLYLPAEIERPAPGIVFFNGHWPVESKALLDHQAFCINMARFGFVVLNFDPPGQGERGLSARDHRRTEALVVGVSQQGINEMETQCAIAYLLSRREVDPERLGMTGASGGGYNTWMTAALDDRIRVFAPVVGTSEFYEQTKTRIPADWGPKDHCHKTPRLNSFANNHELLAMAAPKPVMIVCAVGDPGFPIAGVREVHAYGQKLYSSYGMAERIGFYADATSGHGYQVKKREAVYGWFLRWFLRWFLERGDGSPALEPRTEPEPFDSAELRCFPSGENQAAGAGIVRSIQQIALNLEPGGKAKLQDLLGRLPEALPQQPRILRSTEQRLLIPSEADLTLPAYLLVPPSQHKGLLIGAHDGGKEQLAENAVLRQALELGWAVCGVDPRGVGELATAHNNWIFTVSLLLGENLHWRQGWDMSQAVRYLTTLASFRRLPVALYGKGQASSLAVTYALQMSDLKKVSKRGFIVEDGFVSFRQFIDRPEGQAKSYRLQHREPKLEEPLDREIPPSYFVFDALRHFDLPQLLDDAAAPGLALNPIDGDWRRMSAQDAQRLLPSRVRAVRADAPEDEIKRYLQSISL